jgi:hypothetical protein
MVKGTMDVTPISPPRLNSMDPLCGGWGPFALGLEPTPPANLYTGWFWEDAPVCQYWRDADGPVILRKHDALRTTCYVNNGVTPEAIKHGLVAGAAVEALKNLGAPIPDYPATGVPASTWGDALVDSPVGRELLYGKHPPVNYRVRYACGPAPGVSYSVPLSGGTNCPNNPNVDAEGDYIDGPYQTAQCGSPTSWCNPANIAFACIGEDEMCIGVTMYWALDRLGTDPNGKAYQNLQEAVTEQDPEKVDGVGTPGNTGVPMDPTLLNGGMCPECKTGL